MWPSIWMLTSHNSPFLRISSWAARISSLYLAANDEHELSASSVALLLVIFHRFMSNASVRQKSRSLSLHSFYIKRSLKWKWAEPCMLNRHDYLYLKLCRSSCKKCYFGILKTNLLSAALRACRRSGQKDVKKGSWPYLYQRRMIRSDGFGQVFLVHLIIRLCINTGKQSNYPWRRTICLVRLTDELEWIIRLDG